MTRIEELERCIAGFLDCPRTWEFDTNTNRLTGYQSMSVSESRLRKAKMLLPKDLIEEYGL